MAQTTQEPRVSRTGSPGRDPRLQGCIDACGACATACIDLATQELAACARLCIDCAEICRIAAGFMTRGSSLHAAIYRSCAEVCEACARECEKHAAKHEHCRSCAEACRRCAEECRRMPASS